MNDRSSSRQPSRPFDAIRARLAIPRDISPEDQRPHRGNLHLDPNRRSRTGIPEVVLAGEKSPAMVRDALIGLAEANGRSIASRCRAAHLDALRESLPAGYRVEVHKVAEAAVVVRDEHVNASIVATGGRVGIITAGSSDMRVAAEAALIAAEMGCITMETGDVGVAGLHRLVEPLEAMTAFGVGALVVVAGMDGALPSVVGGLVDVPVIGVPTSTGYGLGGGGEAALLAMLQSCALGLLVVNIDNGIGAGAAAARIANRTATARLVVADDDMSG